MSKIEFSKIRRCFRWSSPFSLEIFRMRDTLYALPNKYDALYCCSMHALQPEAVHALLQPCMRNYLSAGEVKRTPEEIREVW